MLQRHRSSSIRRAIAPVILATSLLVVPASAREGGGTRTGLIVASNVYVLPTNFESVATLVEAMGRLEQPQPIGACCGGAWRVHFAARLERPVDDEALDLEFHDVSSSDRSQQQLRVYSTAIPVRVGEMTVVINDFVISQDLGFLAGHKYEVSLWRSKSPYRYELAKGSFTLK